MNDVLPVTLGHGDVTPETVQLVADGRRIELTPDVTELLARSRAVVEEALLADAPVYGLNTHLGAGRDERVTPEELESFQRRVIANHEGGTGTPLPVTEVRAIITARLAGLSRGGAGVRPELAQALVDLLNSPVIPVVPTRGSVGAGDLTQLAAIAAVLTGRGEAYLGERRLPGGEALAAAGLEAITLGPHEALALLSSNAYSVGVGSLVLRRLDELVQAADRAVALTLEGLGSRGGLGAGGGGNLSPFAAEVQAARGGAGQTASAALVRQLLAGSFLEGSDREVTVQDPLSVRTAPQLHGALRERVEATRAELTLELNARAENPLVVFDADPADPDNDGAVSGRMISGGNFQALPLALDFESLRLTLAHVAAASERRIGQLSDLLRPLRGSGTSVLPGLTWYAAGSALAELRQLAAPATLGSTSLSGVEDHSSLAPTALQLLQRSVALTSEVLAIEAVHAAEVIRVTSSDGDTDVAPLGHGTEPLVRGLIRLLTSGVGAASLVEAAAALLEGSQGS
jgi:histidine ammonia-lyase